MTQPSDAELMSRIKQGDQHAFGMLVRRHVDALYNYAMRLGGSAALADDLVQEAWLAAWQHAQRFNPSKAAVSTWLHRILHNKYIDARRKQRNESDDAAVSRAVDTYDAETSAGTSEAMAVLDGLIAGLPHPQRSALLLSRVQGFSNPEVAQIMGTSVRAVESLIARARRALRERYAALTNEHREQA